MPYLPPELQSLEDRYAELYASVQRGEIDQDTAMVTLDAMTAVDGSGAIWRVNPAEQGFLRAMPGGLYQPARVEEWQPLTHPNTAATTDPYAGFVPAPPTAASGPAWAHAPAAAATPDEPLPAWVPQPEPAVRPGLGERLAPVTAVLGRVKGLVAGGGKRRRYIVVASVCAVLLLVAARAGSSEPATTSPGAPVTTAVPGAADATTAPVPTTPPAPTDKQVRSALKTLTSGDRTKVAALFVDAGEPGLIGLRAAQWAGLGKAGMKVNAGPVAVAEQVTAPLEIVDNDSGQVLYRATLTFVARDGGFVLAGWPEITGA